MNRDSFLLLMIGLLSGFLLGYLSHEQASLRQPNPNEPATAGQAGNQAGPAASSGGMERIQALRQYVEKNPNDADAVRELANLNYDVANWKRAAELYRQYLSIRPEDIGVMTDLGACLRNLGEPAAALEMFRKVLAKKPDHWQAKFNEVLVLGFDLGDWKKAEESLVLLKKLQPDNPDVARLESEVTSKLRSP